MFTDRPLAARNGLDRRPGEMALIDAIRSGAIDKVLLWSVCRIGKSLVELVGFMETCRSSAVSVYLHGQDTIAFAGALRCGGVAGPTPSPVARRILRGQAAARALSIRFGRPPIATAKVERAKQELSAGKGVREAARLAGISAASVTRLKNWVRQRRLGR